MIFSITGYLGSGKTTICEILKEKFGFERVSAGSIQREIAKQMNMTILEFNKFLLESDGLNEYDKLTDDTMIKVAKDNKDKDLIFDSRMAWHFIPESFKIYILVSPYEAARRTYLVRASDDEKYESLDQALNELVERRVVENKKFKNVYGVNCEDLNQYDLVIDTTSITPDKAVEIIMDCYNKKVKKESYEKLWISPEALFPTKPLKEIDMNKLKKSYEAIANHKEMKVKLLRFHDSLFILDGHGVIIAYNLLKHPLINPIITMDEEELKQNKEVRKVIQVNEEDINIWAKLNGIVFNYCPKIIKKLEKEQ